MSTQPGRGGILNAGGRAYEWVRKALGFYGTAVTLAQLIPALVALLAVTLSPTAWLSLTLRRWVLAGVIVGSVVGAAVFALTMRRLLRVDRTAEARTAEWRHAAGQGAEGRDREEPTAIERAAKERDGKGSAGTTAPPTRLRTLAYWGLGTAVLALGLLRLHFAVVDVGVIERWPVLTPVFDFYLGGAPWQATSYNVVAALFSATALVGIVLGAPAAAMLRRDRRRARAMLAGEGGPLHAIAAAEKALTSAKSALSVARSTITSLTDERDSLRAEVALLRGDEAARTERRREPRRGGPRRPEPRRRIPRWSERMGYRPGRAGARAITRSARPRSG